MSYRKVAAVYFDSSARPAQREAFLKLMASFFPAFSRITVSPISVTSPNQDSLAVRIPGILEMQVDRGWGNAHRHLPFVAASDYYANSIEYICNVKYRMSDRQAGLVFDYSHRQANYRQIDLDTWNNISRNRCWYSFLTARAGLISSNKT